MSAIVFMTVLISMGFGIAAAYAVVNGILMVFATHAEPEVSTAPVMVGIETRAGGD